MINTEAPLISVIIITFNSAEFIIETLESIHNQNYDNIELIISDDGSRDATINVCERWLEEHNDRFFATKIITVAKNSGIPANCNRGISASQGDWMKIIAGDDILLEDCLKTNLDFAQKDGDINIVISEMDAFLDGTKPKQILERKKPFGNVFHANHTALDQNSFLVKTSYFGNAPALFYKKSVFEKVAFDESIPFLEDYPFAINATAKGFKFEYLQKVTVLYRVREGSAYFKYKKNIFGNFYKTKFEFDKKYRYPYLDFITLNNELYHYKTLVYFDKYNLNKNNFFYLGFYKIIQGVNPFRVLFFFKKMLSKKEKF